MSEIANIFSSRSWKDNWFGFFSVMSPIWSKTSNWCESIKKKYARAISIALAVVLTKSFYHETPLKFNFILKNKIAIVSKIYVSLKY